APAGTGASPSPSPGPAPDSPTTAALPPFERHETPSHTVAGESDFHLAASAAPPPAAGPLIEVRTLAVHALLQEARRQRRPSMPAGDFPAALQHDLRCLTATRRAAF